MAISWGSWSSNTRLRCGVELIQTPSSVDSDTVSVTITARVYLQTYYASNEYSSNTDWWITGTVTNGSGNTDWNLGAQGYKLMGQTTQSVTLSYSTTQSRSMTGRIHSYYAYPGTEATASTSITIPKRPSGGPVAPSDFVATRVSDAEAALTWTNNSSGGQPYASQTIEQDTFVDSGWLGWYDRDTVSAGASAYNATGLSANRVYRFRVRANNAYGSATSADDYVWMTPGAPTSVASSFNEAGTSITTSWAATNYQTDPACTFNIERQVDSGSWSPLQTGLTGSPYIDSSLPAGTSYRYRVAAVIQYGPLTSGYTMGNIVSTLTAPAAPTGLSPTGVARDLANDLTLYWTHNDGGDGAAQSHYSIQWSSNGGSTWNDLSGGTNIASAISSHHMVGGTLSNGTDYQWRVRTEGVVDAGWGAWSAAATLTGSATPVTNITAPGTTTTSLPLVATWTYSQDQSSPQASWECDLYADGGATLLESRTGTGTGLTTTFTVALQDGVSYVVRQASMSAAGITSGVDTQVTTVDLPPPAGIDTTGYFDDCSGAVVLDLLPNAPGAGEVAVDSATVERRVAGEDWVVLATGLPLPVSFLDPVPLTNGTNEYRITSVSATPSYLINPTFEVNGTDGEAGGQNWIIIRYGAGFTSLVKFRGAPKTSASPSRRQAAQEFLGRRWPTLLLGENRSYEVSASGQIRFADLTCEPSSVGECTYDSTAAQWETAGLEADLVCYRDYTGRRVFGMLSDVVVSEVLWPGIADVSFKVTRTDWTEAYEVGGA